MNPNYIANHINSSTTYCKILYNEQENTRYLKKKKMKALPFVSVGRLHKNDYTKDILTWS